MTFELEIDVKGLLMHESIEANSMTEAALLAVDLGEKLGAVPMKMFGPGYMIILKKKLDTRLFA